MAETGEKLCIHIGSEISSPNGSGNGCSWTLQLHVQRPESRDIAYVGRAVAGHPEVRTEIAILSLLVVPADPS